MRKTGTFLFLFLLSLLTVWANTSDLENRLAALQGISGIER